jgi:monovalent cation:H+ antiporter, CPA1 family
VTHLEALAPLGLLVILVAASATVAVVARRFGIPASVVFVVVGLLVSFVGPALAIPISPDLLLAIVLPGLVFEAAYRTKVSVLRPAASAILLLAVPGVVIVAAVVAAVLAVATPLSPGEAFVVGAMVAATDPAAVLSTFRHVPVPTRLATTVEMESLVNDGTGILLVGLSLQLLGGGGSVDASIVAFVVSIVGSAAIGLALGWLAVRVVRRVDDHVVELAITIILAYGTYLVATAVGVSGVIATLVAAGAFGNLAQESLTDRSVDSIDVVWELVAFLLTAFVFLLVGVAISPANLVDAVGPIAVAIVGVLVARAVVVYGLLGASSRLVEAGIARRRGRGTAGDAKLPMTLRPIPMTWLNVLFWAGLRGAVSVALALSLPADLPNRSLLQEITFGVVLFTLIVQGTTASWVVARSGAADTEDDRAPGLT